MPEDKKINLETNARAIRARWFYLTFFLLIYVSLNTISSGGFDWIDNRIGHDVLLQLFAASFVINAILFAAVKYFSYKMPAQGVRLLGGVQVGAGLAVVALVNSLPGNLASLLFFVPIIEASALLKRRGRIIAAILSGGILALVSYTKVGSLTYDLFVIAGLYLTVGFLIASLFARKEELIPATIATPTSPEPPKDAEFEELKNAAKKAEENARILAAKELELSLANKRLESLEKAKSKFVSVTTHQLRTPLSAIKWTFEMMLNDGLGQINAEQKEFLQKGYEGTKKMINIVNDLLSVDKIETVEAEYDFKPVEISGLIEAAAREFANQASSKQIDVEIAKPAGSVPAIEMDETKIKMVLENLIDNAVKYTPKGGKVKITLSDDRVNSVQNSIEVLVRDSGTGIPEGDRNKIFQKFFRAPNAVTMEPDGSGLGLYIAKDIVERHGGTIWFDNPAEGGTVFHLSLPVHQKKV